MMKWQFWFQTDLGFEATIYRLRKSSEFQGFSSEKAPWFYNFSFTDSKDVKYQITTKGKLSITYPKEVVYVRYKDFLKRLKPFLVKADGTPAKIIEIIKKPDKPKREVSPEQKVKRAVEDLRFLLMRDPKILEIAYKIGETPEALREVVFKLSPKMGWKEPSKDQIKEAEQKICEIYEAASLLEKFDGQTVLRRPTMRLYKELPSKVLQRAKYALKYERQKLPKIVVEKDDKERIEFEFRWPRSSKCFGGLSEYYDKKNKKLSGKWKPYFDLLKQVMKDFKKSMKGET